MLIKYVGLSKISHSMKVENPIFAFFIAIFLSTCALTSVSSGQNLSGLLFTVNSAADSVDAAPGDTLCADANGKCTLRAAVDESNVTFASTAIIFDLPKPAVIELTLGELFIQRGAQVVGPGARQLTIQRSLDAGAPSFRVFRVAGGRVGATFLGLTIRNGNTNGPGGAIHAEAGSFIAVTDSAITGNRAATGGGIASAGRAMLVRTLINGNIATGEGGGVALLDGAIDSNITASTLSDNSAAESGAIDNRGILTLVNDTISRNSAATASSVSNKPNATLNVLNTIIGRDVSTTATALQGTFQSAGNNIVTDSRGSSGFVNGVNGDQVSENNAIDPLLGNLADNGGPTNTMALLAGSPAINNANPCVTSGLCSQLPNTFFRARLDQRRRHRGLFGSGTMDIGAFEDNPPNVISSSSFNLIPFNQTGRFLNAIVVQIDAATLEKRYSVVGLTGAISVNNIGPDTVYVVQVLAKRSGALGPTVIAFD
jgi:CSLREA domain-containing protein